MLILPNGVLGREVLTNLTRPSAPTRYECSLSLDQTVPCERGRRIMLGGLRSLLDTAGFVADRAPVVLVRGADDGGIEYLLRYWILPWNPLSPTTARDRVMSRVLQHLAVAGLAPAVEKSEIYVDRLVSPQAEDTSVAGRAALLARVHLFGGLDAADRGRLATDLVRLVLPAQETVVVRDEVGDTLYVVAEGSLDVFAPAAGGESVRVATLGPGDFFGEMSLLTGEPRRATVRTATAAVLYEMSRETVARLIEERAKVAEILSRAVAERAVVLDEALRHDDLQAQQEQIDGRARQLAKTIRTFFSWRPASQSRGAAAS